MKVTRGTKVIRKCKSCGGEFKPRLADVNRGWGKFCSKSCKAIKQTKKKGYFRGGVGLNLEGNIEDNFHSCDTYSLGQE